MDSKSQRYSSDIVQRYLQFLLDLEHISFKYFVISFTADSTIMS